MDDFEITLSNYRAFSREAPINFRVSDGITFLLGVNNVGKSTLLKAFYELRPFINVGELRNAKNVSPRAARQLNTTLSVPNLTFDRLAHRGASSGPINITFKQRDYGWNLSLVPSPGNFPHTLNCTAYITAFGDPSDDFEQQLNSVFLDSMYVGSFRSPAVETHGNLYDIQIGRNFVNQWDAWANGRVVDHINQIELLEEELRTLFGFSRFSISVSQDKTQLDVKTDDGKFSLSELGDGIAHYIIVLGNALIRRPKFIFIDEPEIGLHPKMQETFVRTLASKAKFGLIATSHSVGLARSVADRIVAVSQDKKGHRRCAPFGEHRNDSLMQSFSELGYSQYAEIGGNHLLLVEGRTDIKAFREILRKFHLEQHFLIWSLNGSDWLKAEPAKIVDELNDLKRLNAKSISVIFDSERTGPDAEMTSELKRFIVTCRSLGFHVFPTDRHSTENYITQAALNDLLPGHTALGPFEVFGSSGQKWDKTKNWLLFQRMKAEDFEGTGLQTFMLSTLKGLVAAAKE